MFKLPEVLFQCMFKILLSAYAVKKYSFRTITTKEFSKNIVKKTTHINTKIYSIRNFNKK